MSMAAAIAILRDAYPRQDFPDRSVALYAHELADLGDDEVTAAVRRLIRRSEWLPSIADIRRDVAEARAQLPTPDEAWSLATTVPHPCPLPPAVVETIRDMGGSWNLRYSDRPTQARREFLRSYELRRERTLLAVMGGAPVPPVVLIGAPRQPRLPESTRIRPRPLMRRLSARWAGRELEPPTDEEKHDAIRVLADGMPDGEPDPLYLEAERVFAEASSDQAR